MDADPRQAHAAISSLLGWWEEAGVDCAVADGPREWLRREAPPEEPQASTDKAASAPHPGAEPRVHPPEEPLPAQLSLFQEWLRSSEALPFSAPGAPRVCPSGDPASGLMVLVPMPSGEDCRTGALLSGPAGRLFDAMLAAIGRSRDTIYLAGLSCLRPPGGTLGADEGEQCARIARHHIGLAAPKAVLLFGDACARALLGAPGVARARGRVHSLLTPSGSVDAIVTLHPDYLLSQPSAKALAWADLQLLMEKL